MILTVSQLVECQFNAGEITRAELASEFIETDPFT